MRILLAVDGSDNSYEAVQAVKFLGRTEAITLLHVLDVPKPVYPGLTEPGIKHEFYEMERTMRADAERLFDRILPLLSTEKSSVTKRLVTGSPCDAIITRCNKGKIDLVVLGTRGLGPALERLIGSVAHRVVTLAKCAKLIINGPMQGLKNVLVPLQGPSDAKALIRFLRLTSFQESMEMTVLTVVQQVQPWSRKKRTVEEQALQSARNFVDGVSSQLTAFGYQACGLAVLGSPVKMILQEAAKLNPDLILTGSRGRQGITRSVLGSVSHSLLHQPPCPILVFQ